MFLIRWRLESDGQLSNPKMGGMVLRREDFDKEGEGGGDAPVRFRQAAFHTKIK